MGLPIITLISPENTYSTTGCVVDFNFTYSDSVDLLQASNIDIEIDIVDTFDSVNKITYSYTLIDSNTTIKRIVPLESDTWYWRVIAINADGTTVSDTYSFVVSRSFKRVLYQYFNLAKKPPEWTNTRVLYQYENIISYLIEGQWIRARNIRFKRRL